jgi:hypothetical protein
MTSDAVDEMTIGEQVLRFDGLDPTQSYRLNDADESVTPGRTH